MNFDYLCYNIDFKKENDVNIKLNRFQQFCGTIKQRALLGK
jgi:hypothetical protein